MRYQIRVKGHLDPSWQEWFEYLYIIHEGAGTSLLSGPLKDQAALYGVLFKMSRLSLTLLSLQSSEIEQQDDGSGPALETRFSKEVSLLFVLLLPQTHREVDRSGKIWCRSKYLF